MTSKSAKATAPSHSHRICFVAPFGLRMKGTVRARTLPLARELAKLGHAVCVVIPPWDSPEDAGKEWTDGKVRIVNVDLRGGLPLILARMLAEMRRFRPTVLHIVKPRAHAGLVQWLAWQSRRAVGRPDLRIVLDVDDWEQAWEDVVDYPRPLARFLAWQEEWGIRHADAITAASRWLTERVRHMAPGTPVLYLPNGVDVADVPLPADESAVGGASGNAPTVLLFSRFVEVDPAWMGELWAHLQKAVPGVRLLVAGQAIAPHLQDAMRVAIEAQSQSSARVEWLGYVDPPRMDAMLAQVGCVIFPAAEIPLNQAKCSVRLATTLTAGLPVVASAVGEQVSYGGDGAARLVAADASPADFAQAVADLLAEPGDRVALAAQARRRMAERYSWEILGRRLHDFYA